jgi:hypothetical protein
MNNEKKEGFYMGIRQKDENGNIMSVENTYGFARTVFLGTALIVGSTVIVGTVLEGIKYGAEFVSDKVNNFKERRRIKKSQKESK